MLDACARKLTKLYQARRSRWALAESHCFYSHFLYQLLQSTRAPCSAVSATELFYLPGRQVWLCPPSAWHGAKFSSPFRSSLVWQLCVPFIYGFAFQACLTTLLSRRVCRISCFNKDINSVATLDSMFASVIERKWYVSSSSSSLILRRSKKGL